MSPQTSETTNGKREASISTPSDTEIVITRVFDAPAAILFDTWTKPEHVRNWYGLRSMKTTVVDIDLRVGGAWRWVQEADDGTEVAFSGVYNEIDPPGRLVYTEGFEAMPGPPLVVTLTFDEHDGKTTLTSHSPCPSVEVRDAILQSGMEYGVNETYERLDELLATLQ
jgi:uncharacterized protein YndB with AHSA1/START domain